MIISGYNYRSIFEQTGLSFDFNCSIDNITGSGAFGFSGEGNQIQFTFQSGKIYDFENRYVNSYQINTNFNISGDIENNNYSYYINNNPISFDGVRSNLKIQNFYYNAKNCNLNTSLILNGANSPDYTLFFPSDFQISKPFTGYIYNNINNLNFKVFSGSLDSTGNFNINYIDSTVSGLKSGRVIFNSANEVGAYNITVNLYTNFGAISQNILLTGLFNLDDVTNLSVAPTDLSIIGDRNSLNSIVGNLIYSREIFSGNTTVNSFNNLPLNIKLEYYSGATGEFKDNILGTGYGYNLIGSGIITQESEIFKFTGLSAITGQNYKNITYTGLFPATGYANVIATGIFDYNIIYQASGYMTGLALGTFNLPYYIQPFTGGIPIDFLTVNTAGTGVLTGLNTSWLTGTVSGTGFIFSGTVTGSDYLYLSNIRSGLFTGYLSGDLDATLRTGIITFSPGSKSRIPKTVTGDFQIINSGLPITLNYSGLVYNRDNIYSYYKNLNQSQIQSLVSQHPGLLTGFQETKIERKGLVIFNSGNPNNFTTNPIIYNIKTGEVNRIITYPNLNLAFIVGNFDYINDTTGRWNGFLLTGNNFNLTGWDPKLSYNSQILSAYLNDIFLTGDNVYMGGKFNEIGLLNNNSSSTFSKIKITGGYGLTDFYVMGGDTVNKFLNIDNKLYVFGNFYNFGDLGAGYTSNSSGNYTNKSLWSNPKSQSSSSAAGFYNSLFIIDPSNDKVISDPYDAHWNDYIGVTGYNQINFERSDASLTNNYTIYNSFQNTGKNYIVGDFQAVGVKRRIGIAAYDEQENLMAYNPEINSDDNNINFIYESGNLLFVGGSINDFGGIKYNNAKDINGSNSYNIVKLNNPFTIDRTFIPSSFIYSNGSSANVYDISFSGTKVYAVGDFQYVISKTGGLTESQTWNPRSGCAIFDASGNLLNEYFNFKLAGGVGTLKSIFITGSTGYFGGKFDSVYTSATSENFGTRYKFAAIDLGSYKLLSITGNFDPADATRYVNKIDHYTGNHILVVGDFNNIETDEIPTTTVVNGISFLDTSPAPSENINLITDRTTSQSSNNNFQGFTKFITNNISGIFLYGDLSSTININDENTTTIGIPSYDNRIIQLDITGGLITGFNPSINGTVYSAFVTGDSVIIGGDFTIINNTDSYRVANLTTGNGILKLDTYTGYLLNDPVFNIINYRNNLITIGEFTSFSGNKIGNHFLYHNISGSNIYNSLKFNENGNLLNIKQYNNNLYIVGKDLFPIINRPLDSTKRFGMVALNNSPTGFFIPDNDFNKNLPLIDDALLCFATGSSGIYIGGRFKSVNNQERTGLGLIDYNGNVLNWNPIIDGGNLTINSLALSGNSIFIGGNFNKINNLSIPCLAKVRTDTNGNSISDVDINFLTFLNQTTTIKQLLIDNQTLYVGGNFSQISNSPINAFANLNTTNANLIPNGIIINDSNASINKILKTGDVFIIGGQFEYDANATIKNFLPIKIDGTISTFPTGFFVDDDPSKQINDITIGKNNKIYLCGNLGINSNVINNLGGGLSLNFNSGSNTFTINNWTPYLENQNPNVIYQSKLNNNIYILNRFNYAGHLRQGICEINNSGKLNLTFNPKININSNEYIKDVKLFNNTGIIIGGNFTNINNNTGYKNFAILNTQDSSSTNLGINFSNVIKCLHSTGSNIYIGGNFEYITGSNTHQYFGNFIGFDTGNINLITNTVSFIENIDNETGNSNININSIANLSNKFLIGGNFKSLNPYVLISGSGAFISGINSVNSILTGTGNLTLNNFSGIYRDNLQYSGAHYSSNYNFSYVSNQGSTINSNLNRSINEILNTSYLTHFTGVKSYIETGSGIITGIQTLIKSTGTWLITGVFTGNLSGYKYDIEYLYGLPMIGTGNLSGSGFGVINISGDSFSSNQTFTGTISNSQAYAISTYTGISNSGTFFQSDGNFYVTGINVNGSKVISGLYTGLSTGLILQINSNGSIINPQISFITSGNYEYVTGNLGVTYNYSPLVYATGIFTFTTGNIFTTGYLTGIPSYTKDFTGSFNILTGLFDTGINATNYTGLNIYNNIYTGSHIYDTGTIFNFLFTYKTYTDNEPLIAKLTLSGSESIIYTTLITGI